MHSMVWRRLGDTFMYQSSLRFKNITDRMQQKMTWEQGVKPVGRCLGTHWTRMFPKLQKLCFSNPFPTWTLKKNTKLHYFLLIICIVFASWPEQSHWVSDTKFINAVRFQKRIQKRRIWKLTKLTRRVGGEKKIWSKLQKKKEKSLSSVE